MRPRWDIDTRGEGIGDGRRMVPGVRDLIDALEVPRWVAEDPHLHLFPHLRRRCGDADFPLELAGADVEPDGTYVVELRATEPQHGRAVKAAVFALIGEIAEPATYVRMREREDPVVYEVVTGVLDGDSEFAPHGHMLVLRVS